jgi:hypothetical protein
MFDERYSNLAQSEKPSQGWAAAWVLGAILAMVVGGLALSGPPKANTQVAAPAAANGTKLQQLIGSPPTPKLLQGDRGNDPPTETKQASNNGLSYETVIPRPTVKGYYEPKVVPYPTGKPVFVNGYYRKDGTYVQPHFRSLPKR